MKRKLAIVTSVYNCKKYISRLYESLKEQTNKNFLWLVIDDGSTDDTEGLINNLKTDAPFDIKYIKKNNGGKHTALNIAFRIVEEEFTFIVDGDDYLTRDAVQSVYDTMQKITENKLCGVSFLRGYDDKTCIGNKFPDTNKIFNGIDIQFKYNVKGDKAEIWKTDILRKYQFPVYKDERFQGENYVWWQILREYDMLYINEIIYITEYLKTGLSFAGRKMRISNPLGGMENSKQGMIKGMPLKCRIKCGILYNCYGFFAEKKINEILNNSSSKLNALLSMTFGYALYRYWKHKYRN